MKQGAHAARQGDRFESNLAGQLEAAGIEFQQKVRIPGGGLWDDGDAIADFLLQATQQYPTGLYLEAKWQDSNGTATIEKIPYVVARIKECYPLPGALVVGGDRMTRCLAWALRQVDNKFVAVMDESQFTRWLMRNGF